MIWKYFNSIRDHSLWFTVHGWHSSREIWLVVTGKWILLFRSFQFTLEFHHPNWRTFMFFRGVRWNHQPDMYDFYPILLYPDMYHFYGRTLQDIYMYIYVYIMYPVIDGIALDMYHVYSSLWDHLRLRISVESSVTFQLELLKSLAWSVRPAHVPQVVTVRESVSQSVMTYPVVMTNIAMV